MATNGFASSKFTQASFGAGTTPGANAMFLTQVNVIRSATVVAVLSNITNANASLQYKAVIYDGAHSALLGAGSIAGSVVAGYNRFQLAAPVTLSAGTYYVGYVCNTSLTVSVWAAGNQSWFLASGQSVASPANPLVGGASNASNQAIALEFDGSTAAAFGYAPDYSNNVTLSVSNTVATTTSAALMGARSVVTQSVPGGGKYYAEIATGGTLTTTWIGLMSAGSPIDAPLSGNMITEVLLPSGTAAGIAGASIATGISYVSGDVVGIAYDAGAGLLWFNKNGGAFGGNGAGNPATGTNGLAVTPGNWPMMILAASNSAANFTLRDYAASQAFSRPSGYSAWSPYVAASASQARAMVLA